MQITLKTEEHLEKMRVAGRIAADTLTLLSAHVAPGVSTKALDKLAEDFIRSKGGVPTCLGYKNFPASVCISVNHQAVHCIPSDKRLREGDIVKLDLVVGYQGFQADTAKTCLVPPVDPAVIAFVKAGQDALWAAIPKAIDGNTVSDLSNTIHAWATSRGYGAVKEFVGHGIGRDIHEAPQIPNFLLKNKGPLLVNGMVICIEPILTFKPDAPIYAQKDVWDTWTLDGSPVCHWEHSVAITEKGPEVLTLRDEERIERTGDGAK